MRAANLGVVQVAEIEVGMQTPPLRAGDSTARGRGRAEALAGIARERLQATLRGGHRSRPAKPKKPKTGPPGERKTGTPASGSAGAC